jgi:hypothetical protein
VLSLDSELLIKRNIAARQALAISPFSNMHHSALIAGHLAPETKTAHAGFEVNKTELQRIAPVYKYRTPPNPRDSPYRLL